MANITVFFLSPGAALWHDKSFHDTEVAEGGGTLDAMKLRDQLTLAAIVGGLLLMFFLTRYSQPERVKPGSPEYDAYIDHYIAECLRNPPPADKSTGSQASPSESEREAACRVYVRQADRLNPDVRPLKRQ